MKVVVSLEYRFESTPDGAVWTQTAFAYHFWTQYLDVFDQVRVVARVRAVSSVPTDARRVDGECVSFTALPYYVGPWQYVMQLKGIQNASKRASDHHSGVILRVPSVIADSIQRPLQRQNYPYGVEVLGDPYDVFARGSVDHPLRPFFRWWFARHLRYQCQHACAATYVTQCALQRRYPPSLEAFSTHYSDVDLSEEAFIQSPRPVPAGKTAFTLIMVGSLDQLYKGPDVLIEALSTCVRNGLNVRLNIVGDGRYRPQLELQASALGLQGRIRFLGQLPAGDAVRAQLDQADVFVLPSKTEGLPRAMLEAMARGLPCIGSNVGGIPELLPPENLVVPGDAAGLARKIKEVLADPERVARMSARNLNKAREYHTDILHKRRIEFYRYVRQKTEAWLRQSGNR
jgi:glycosyltransferase involved in cell wall biosynthesis